jgi:phage shock protein PspC (stress-responsive transcriptional regulator)
VLLAYLVAGLLLPGKPLTYYGSRDERELWRPAPRRRGWRHEARAEPRAVLPRSGAGKFGGVCAGLAEYFGFDLTL